MGKRLLYWIRQSMCTKRWKVQITSTLSKWQPARVKYMDTFHKGPFWEDLSYRLSFCLLSYFFKTFNIRYKSQYKGLSKKKILSFILALNKCLPTFKKVNA